MYLSKFYTWRKLEYSEKAKDQPQVTDKLYHKMMHQVHLTMSYNQTHNYSGGSVYM